MEKKLGKIVVGLIGVIALIWVVTFMAAECRADFLGVYSLTEYIIAPVHSIDSDGNEVDADSAHVLVWEEGVGDNTVTYSARTSDMTADWIAEYTYAGGVKDYYFRDQAQDIDAGQLHGQYVMKIKLFAGGEGYSTIHTFDVTSTGEREVDVNSMSTSTNAADSLELRMLRHDQDDITDKLAAMGLADSAAAIWGDTADSPGERERLLIDGGDAADLEAKVDTAVWESRTVYNEVTVEDWANHFYQYDDGVLFDGCEGISGWTFEHGGNGRLTGEATHTTQGDSAISIWTGDGDTAIVYKELLTYDNGRYRIPYISTITFDLFIDTATCYRSHRVAAYADSTSSLHYLKVKMCRDLEDGPFDITTSGFLQYIYLDQALVSGWNHLIVPMQGMAEIGDADSSDVGLQNKYIGFEIGVDGANDSVRVVIDNIRFNVRSRAKLIFRYDDGLQSQYTRGWPLHRKYHQHATYAVRGNNFTGVDSNIYMLTNHLDVLYAEGNDIINHGYTGLYLYDVTDSTARRNIDQGQQALNDHGYQRASDVFAYPSNGIDTIGLRILKENHKFACGGRNSIHHGHVDVITDPTADELYNFPYVYMEYSGSESMDKYRRMVDTAILQGSLLILSMHEICSTDSANGSDATSISTNVDSLDAFLSYVYDRRALIDVTTFSEYFAHQRTFSAQLNTIENNTDLANDSLEVLNEKIDAMRDSLQYLVTGGGDSNSTTGITYAVEQAAINLDNASGTLSNAQIDDDIEVDVKTWAGTPAATADDGWVTAVGFSTHSAGDIWTVGTRRLTELDEDNTTIDLDGSAVGSVSGNVDGNVAGSVGSVTAGVTLRGDSLGTLMGDVDDIKSKTDNLPTDPADDSDIDGQLAAIQADLDNPNQYKATGFSTHGPGDPWDVATSDHTTIGTFAELLEADSTNIAAIKERTDNLPDDPADDSDIDGQLSAINAKTTNLPSDPADDSDIDGQLATIQADLDNPSQYMATGFSTFDPDADTVGLGTGTYTAIAKESSLFDPDADTVGLGSGTYAALVAGSSSWADTLRNIMEAIFDTTLSIAPDSTGGLFERLTWIAENMASAGADSGTIHRILEDELNVARDATKSDYQSTTGPGAIPVRVYAYDSTNAVSVAGVRINVKLADGTPKHYDLTGSDGWANMTLAVGERYIYAEHNNYDFTTPACTLTVPTDSLRDTVYATAFDPGDPGDADLKRIYGWIKNAGDVALEGAIVTLTLDVPGDTIPYQTGTGVTIHRTAVRDTTDADGYWSLDIYPVLNGDGTAFITPASSEYHYRATYDNNYLSQHQKTFRPSDTTATAITSF